jgi:hypothetical protein
MNSFLFTTDKSLNDCKQLLIYSITVKHNINQFLIPSMSLKEEMIGNVHDNKFWLLKHSIKPNFGIRRVLKGRISQEDGITIISGKFKFPFIYKIASFNFVTALFVIFVLAWSGVIGSGSMNLTPFAIFLPLPVVYLAVSTLLNKKEEHEVISLMENLFKNTASANE